MSFCPCLLFGHQKCTVHRQTDQSIKHPSHQVPAPLGIGTVDLDDGTQVKGFICEAWVAEAATNGDSRVEDITHLGSWLQYLSLRRD